MSEEVKTEGEIEVSTQLYPLQGELGKHMSFVAFSFLITY